MEKNYKKVLMILLLILISNFGYSQTNEITIKFIGNAGLYITDGNTDLYVDFPYKSGAYNYMEYDKSELENIKTNSILLFTHKHADHYSKKLLKKIDGRKYGPWNISELEKLQNSILDLNIKAFKTKHKVFGIASKHYSYLISWHGKKIYISGDTGELEIARELKDVDWAFINPWLFMQAQEDKVSINTKMFGIYHLYPTQKLPEEVPENIVFMKNQGAIISIPY